MKTKSVVSMTSQLAIRTRVRNNMKGLMRLFVLLAIVGVSCGIRGSDAGSHQGLTEAGVWGQGRAPYQTFDEAGYRRERYALIDSLLQVESFAEFASECSEQLELWLSLGHPARFWAAVQKQFCVSEILLTLEVGSTESRHYWCGTLVKNSGGAAVVTCEVNDSENIKLRRISPQDLVTVKSKLEDEYNVFALTPEIHLGVMDAAVPLLLLYVDGRQKSLTGNEVFHESGTLSDLFEYINEDVFLMRRGE